MMMPSRLCRLLICALLVLGQNHQAYAFLPRDTVELSVEVIINAVEGAPRSGCEASKEITTYWKREWGFMVAEIKPHSQTASKGSSGGIRCVNGSVDKTLSETNDSSRHSYFVAEVSTVARPIRQMEDERIVSVNVSLSLRKFTGFDQRGSPIYQQSDVNRELYFTQSRDAFLPLLVANVTDREALGIHEIFLRVGASVVEKTSLAAYGTISVISDSVISDVKAAELLLDGGTVRKTSDSGETTLRNVPVGLRQVQRRDALGREISKVVRVVANRTVLVDLSLEYSALQQASYRLLPLGTNAHGHEEYRREVDGAVVVKIPAGEFLMGNKETERTPLEHRVYLSQFLMDKLGVTWGQYKKFLEATATPMPPHEPYWGVHDDHPAVFVTWEEAKMYCEWAGGRLPTEAEREKAARGTDDRKYPWGNEEPDSERGVFRRSWGQVATGAVGTHPAGASPYGLLDMGGNVWEWCSDWYDGEYYAASPYRDPKGPRFGTTHVVRGGSWDSRPSVLSASTRSWGHLGYRDGDFGFRCAMSVPK